MRRGQVERILLNSLAIAGIGLIAIAAPNVVQLLKKFDPEWMLKRDPKQRLQEVASKLKRKGMVEFVEEDGRTRMRITGKGRKKLESAILAAGIQPHGKWDKKWRLVIFDIPEKQKATRAKIRQHLRAFGFQRLQHSVWVYPYDCEDLILLLKTELAVGRRLLYIIADAVEYDLPIKQLFGLK